MFDSMQPNSVAQVLTLLGFSRVVLDSKLSWDTSYNERFVIFVIPFTAGVVPLLVQDILSISRYHWPRRLSHGSLAVRLLGLWVRIMPQAWMSISCECCVLSSRGDCDGLIIHPGEFYRVWCV
jgi:hypothetical protein